MGINSIAIGGLCRNVETKEKVIKFSVGQKAHDQEEYQWFNCVKFGEPETLRKIGHWLENLNSITVTGNMNVKKYNDQYYYTIFVRDFEPGEKKENVQKAKPQIPSHAEARQEQPNYSTNPKTLPQYETSDEIPF